MVRIEVMIMTLDEAILHAREVAERNRAQYKNCPADRRDIEHQTCEQCAKEHEQLAEWLEDYKHIKQWKSDVMDDFCRYDVSSFEELVTNIRNKAIDDFVNRIDSVGYISVCADCLSKRQIREIADQLKVENTNG